MSIIERAFDKQGGAPAATSVAPVTPSSTIEKAVEAWAEQHEAVAETAPVAAIPVTRHEVSTPGETVEANGGVDVQLDIARLQAAGLLVMGNERNLIAEEFRMIKRPLLKNAFGQSGTAIDNANLIMVTSAFPSEGKTFTALNLALSIATEMDRTVLLVDADVARPSIATRLGIETGDGLVDYLLQGDLKLQDLLIRTDIPKLSLLPAGRRHVNSTELLASDAMRTLMGELSRRYADRIVIFDTPPLLSTSEAAVLASLVGQIVVVVEAQQTTHEVLKEALSHIEANKIVGLVLNKSQQPFGHDYYGAHAYYGK